PTKLHVAGEQRRHGQDLVADRPQLLWVGGGGQLVELFLCHHVRRPAGALHQRAPAGAASGSVAARPLLDSSSARQRSTVPVRRASSAGDSPTLRLASSTEWAPSSARRPRTRGR